MAGSTRFGAHEIAGRGGVDPGGDRKSDAELEGEQACLEIATSGHQKLPIRSTAGLHFEAQDSWESRE